MTTDPKFETVMVIDDNSIDLYVTARLLNKHNICNHLLQYSCAKDALDYLVKNSNNPNAWPQLLLVDIYMPEMSGFEFMEAFDKLPLALKKYPKVFIVSSSIDEHDIERAANDKNVTAFQEKPVNLEFLEKIS